MVVFHSGVEFSPSVVDGFFFFFLVLHQPVTPYRPPVVVDWASGVAPKPDPKTISKHVQRMVDVSVASAINTVSLIFLCL